MFQFLRLSVLILTISNGFCQYSPELKALVENLNVTDATNYVEHYSNGNIKLTGTLNTFEVGGKTYSYLAGKAVAYYKNGQVLSITTYDHYGNTLKHESYYGDGNLHYESITQHIDTKAASVHDFFNNDNLTSFTLKEKRYAYSNKLCNYYLKKEGLKHNTKKIGIWYIYNPDGSLKKSKSYTKH